MSLNKAFQSRGPRPLPWDTEALVGHSAEAWLLTATESDLHEDDFEGGPGVPTDAEAP